MRADVIVERIEETWPRLKARISGAIYLSTISKGIFAQGFVRGRLVVVGDVAEFAQIPPRSCCFTHRFSR
jgi:hypothetical protein